MDEANLNGKRQIERPTGRWVARRDGSDGGAGTPTEGAPAPLIGVVVFATTAREGASMAGYVRRGQLTVDVRAASR